MEKPRSFLLNTRTSWLEPPRARHQVAEALAKRHRVYFVSANLRGCPRIEVFESNSGVTVITPYWPVSCGLRYRMPGINEIYQQWFFSTVKHTIQPSYVINFDHTATQVFQHFRKVIYYCNDYHLKTFRTTAVKRYFHRCERIVARQSLLCVATCDFLRQRLAAWNGNSCEIRLGAPITEEPPVYRKRSQETVLSLVDFVSEKKTDLGVLDRLGSDPACAVMIFGPVSSKALRRIGQSTNIQLHGVLTGESLVEKLRNADVGIAPYSRTDGNLGRTPNKLWLYLAAGLPSVVTDLEAIREWDFKAGFVYRADNPKQFHEMVLRACYEDSPELRRERFEFAQSNSWDSRVDHLLSILPE